MNFLEILEEADTIGITGHISPDGDSTGGSLALYNYVRLNYTNKDVDIYLEKINDSFSYLKGAEDVSVISKEKKYDLFITLDCSTLDRIKPFFTCYENAKVKVCIDHHISNDGNFADFNIINATASSTCEVLYDLLDKEKINVDIAKCLYTGIIHDTGVFKYDNTSPNTLRVAADLISYGFDFTTIIEDTFFARSLSSQKTLAKVLEKAKTFCDGKAIFSYITKKEMEENKVKKEDLAGFVEQLRLTNGIELAVFIYPSDGSKKVSMRSKKMVDVSVFAKKYGGGGHIKAAGFSTFSSYEDIIKEIEDYARKTI